MTLHSPDRDRVSHHNVGAGDCAGLLSRLEQRARARWPEAGDGAEREALYEAGYDGFWLHRRLPASGIENDVFDPGSIAVE